jgi:WD40 repeat protein
MQHARLACWLVVIAGMGVCLVEQYGSAQEPKEWTTLIGHTANVPNLVFSADGKMLASCSWDATIRLWEVASSKELATFKDRTDKIWSVAITSDGTTLASGSNDGTITIWDVANGKQKSTFKGDPEAVRSVVLGL